MQCIGLFATSFDWLFMAKIYVEYDDSKRAEAMLAVGKESAKREESTQLLDL